jgi:hypothetical protein
MKVYKGENLIIRIDLRQQTGDPLNLVDLISLRAAIKQNKQIVVSYLFGTDPEIREGNNPNEIEIELKSSVTDVLLPKHDVFVKLIMHAPNEEFEVDADQVDITEIKAFSMYD